MDLENEQLQLLCRTCLMKRNNMKDIYSISDIIMKCASIQVDQDDGLPSMICSSCIILAKNSYDFRLMCELANNVLRNELCTHYMEDGNYLKVEVCTDSDCSTDDEAEVVQNQTNDPLASTNIISNINNFETIASKTINECESETFETHKNEILDLSEGEDNIFTDENFTVEYSTSKYKGPDLQVVTSEIIENEQFSDGNENLNEITSDTSVDNIISNIAVDFEDTSEGGFPCQGCRKHFLTRKGRDEHEKKHVQELKCRFCDEDFPNLQEARTHVSTHKQKEGHLCSTCGKKFNLLGNLAIHQRLHTGTKPYTCKLCNKSFTQRNELKSHEVTHSAEKAYLCSTCGKTFARLISLKYHMDRTHPNPLQGKPYACIVCDLKFKVRYDLKKHMLCHSDERNSRCKVCNKAFKNNKYLRQHEKIHTGHKPYVCPICQKAFLQKHVLTSHLRVHTQQK